MSMLLMVHAMKAKVGNPLRKLVLIKLADNSNDDGECWPSYQHIADHCEVSKRSVIAHIAELERMGYLRREFRKDAVKGNKSNIFHLCIPSESPAPPSANAALGSESPALPPSESPAPRTSHSFEPVKEPKDICVKKPKKRFTPPTEQEVFDYMVERGIDQAIAKNESFKFVNRNIQIGWVVGKSKTPMKDWKAAVRLWLNNMAEWSKQNQQSPVFGLVGQSQEELRRQEMVRIAEERQARRQGGAQ